MKKYISLLVVFFIVIHSDINAQDKYLGGVFGYRKLSSSPLKEYYAYGLKYEIKYPEERTSINFEGVYEEKYQVYKENNISYAKFTLGLDFNFGKRVTTILGFGFFLKGLLNEQYYYNSPQIDVNASKIILGGKLNLGMGYKISDNLIITVLAQYNVDITKTVLITTEHSTKSGGVSFFEKVEHDKLSFFQFSVFYKFSNKKN